MAPQAQDLDTKTTTEHLGTMNHLRQGLYSDEAAYQCLDEIISTPPLSAFHRSHSSAKVSSIPPTLQARTSGSMIYSPHPARFYNLPGRSVSSTEHIHHPPRVHPSAFVKASEPQVALITQGVGAIKLLASEPYPRRLSWTALTQRPSSSKTPQTIKFKPSTAISTLPSQSLFNDVSSPGEPTPVLYQRARKTSLGDPSSGRWLQKFTRKSSAGPTAKQTTDKQGTSVGSSRIDPIDALPLPSPSVPHSDVKQRYPPNNSSRAVSSSQLRSSSPKTSYNQLLTSADVTQRIDSVFFLGPTTHYNTLDILPRSALYQDPQSIDPLAPRAARTLSNPRQFTRLRNPIRSDLRQILCPDELIDSFVVIATPELDQKIELCGLLLGILAEGILTITTLLIPKQISTADSCKMTDDVNEVFRFQDSRNLMTLGWIHTHPTQTCFMSSLDLHTHASYQSLLPEAVAIVLSPKSDPAVGIFKLTDPPGLQTIVGCKAPGAFHPHPEGVALYTDADQHLIMLQDLPLEIIDLRV